MLNISPEEIQQDQGSKNPEDVEDGILSEETRAKAIKIVAEATQARANGDQKKVEEINRKIIDDPELGKLIKEKQSNSVEQNLLPMLKEAQKNILDKMTKMFLLHKSAKTERVSLGSLFKKEEWNHLIPMLKVIEAANAEQKPIDKKLASVLYQWYQRATLVVSQKNRYLIEYSNGSPPVLFTRQVRLFDDMSSDFDRIKHYFTKASE